MKRFAVMLVLLLLLGAIVNVAVAWGIWYQRVTHDQLYASATLSRQIAAASPSDLEWLGEDSADSVFVIRESDRYLDQRSFVETSKYKDGAIRVRWVRLDVGWPMRALNGGVWIDARYGGFELKRPRVRNVSNAISAMPRHPLWPGFAINTVFYAAILWLLFAFPFALRRQRRIKRSLCSACAYPIGESDVCTECGEPVKA